MTREDYSGIVAFIWKIADEVLRDKIDKTDYQKIILPMFVLRRFDLTLDGVVEKVLARKKVLEKREQVDMDSDLCYAAGQAFYNTSGYSLKSMLGKSGGRLKQDFDKYLRGFSPSVQEVLRNFEFDYLAKSLFDKGILLRLIERFLDAQLDLSRLDNHAMGTVFEELVRKFSEERNEGAGAYWTPRDAVRLMTKLVFSPIQSTLKNGSYSIYDGACGTGGMLTIAEDTLNETGKQKGENAVICNLYGQEMRQDIYAICRADMLLRTNRKERKDERIRLGSTLSADKYENQKFDFMLSNPPFGTHWKDDKKEMDNAGGADYFFPAVKHGTNGEMLSLLPRISDGQMLFLVNAVRKMKKGSRIAEVHNGSSLFTGEAGSGESNVRRWIIENDWLEAIVALPENMFYNTGITTYIWVLAHNKAENRKGKVQLIDAGERFGRLPRNLGSKNCELLDTDIEKIMSVFLGFKETDESKIFRNEEFGYQQIVVQRPLRLRGQLSKKAEKALLFASGDHELRTKIYEKFGEQLFLGFDKISAEVTQFVETLCGNDDTEEKDIKKTLTLKKKLTDGKTWAQDWQLSQNAARLRKAMGGELFADYNVFRPKVRAAAQQLKISNSEVKKILKESSWREADAPPVEKENTKHKSLDKLHGVYKDPRGRKSVFVEYESDLELKDTEQVPLLESGGIASFVEREVWPYVPDAWVDKGEPNIGYEISFNRHFYSPQPLRELAAIRANIDDVQKSTKKLLDDLLAGV